VSRRKANQRFRRDLDPARWLARHLQMALAALGRLSRSPVATGMTTAVIGIAFALPAGLYLAVDSVRGLSSSWHGTASISLFLDDAITDAQARQVQGRIDERADVAETRLITRAEALDEFRRLSGFGGAIDLLDENPLPAVVLVRPTPAAADAGQAAALARELESFREIALAQVDLQWVERLAAITRLVERGTLILAVLLAGAVLLVVGNTVRLEIQNRRSEIEVIKLIGGTDAFVRRPFLYEGAWYGLFGALIAVTLIVAALAVLSGPVQRLAGLYAAAPALDAVRPGDLLMLLAAGPMLGLGGAWTAVGRHLRDIEPG
jgi:cell division transport system permease protein